jgi:glycosyl transferase family 25
MTLPFQYTYYINLESRTDRLTHVRTELDKIGCSTSIRFNAIKTSSGAVGCTISHIKCLELAKQNGHPYVFICEDDICFSDPDLLVKNTKEFFEKAGGSWDVLIIGGNMMPPYQQVGNFCARILNCQTTTGYIVRQPYYDKLIKNFREGLNQLMKNPTNKREFAIDMYWKRLQEVDRWYIIIPLTVHQLEGYSDIEERDVNYKNLMMDMNKEWLFKRAMSMPFI